MLVCKYVNKNSLAGKRWDPPWLRNPGQPSPEVQNIGISGVTKRIDVLKKCLFQKNKKPWKKAVVPVQGVCENEDKTRNGINT